GGAGRRPRMLQGGHLLRALDGLVASGGLQVKLDASTPFGRGKARLEVELKRLDQPFDGTGLAGGDFLDVGTGPVTLSKVVAVPSNDVFHWRARLKAPAGQGWWSPWSGLPDNALSEADFRALRGDLVVSSLSAPTLSGAGKSIAVTDSTRNNGP